MKRLVRSVLTHPWVLPLAFPFTRGAAAIFMLHRFADPATGRPGHDVDVLRADLAWLRRHRFTVLPLDALLERLRAGEPVYKTVTFTVDDGYADFAGRALPAFAAFDCPVTVFLVTGFVDGRCWLWWDVVEYLVTRTARDGVRVGVVSGEWTYRWQDGAGRVRAVADLVERLKAVPEAERLEVIGALPALLDVELPAHPPREYQPLTWDAVRRCAASGASFGPHTVTHPILSRTGDAQAEGEIAGSWRKVREEAGDAAVPVFCYPNGDPASFGAREQELVARAGLTAALSTVQGYADAAHLAARSPSAFAVPRMPYAQDGASFVQVASGIERAKAVVRAAVRREPAVARVRDIPVTGSGT